MLNTKLWSSFEEVYCLTLEGDIDRQRHASAELCRVGLSGFKFVEGISANSSEVKAVYEDGLVKTFPPCFRCSSLKCDKPECNNILIESQVGCFLSFIKIFKEASNSSYNTFIIIEDDVIFLEHYEQLAELALSPEALEPLGFFSDEACLIGLGRGASVHERFTSVHTYEFVSGRKQPQNPCFAFNKKFAELALASFGKISHTIDVFIHFEISDQARHYSLEPPIASEVSTSTGSLPSRIHPKLVAVANESNTEEARQAASAALANHNKHVEVVPLLVVGVPRGGTGYMSHALKACGLDVGHESIGEDGISSWLFAVDDTNLPFGTPGLARNSRFVYPERTVAVVRTDPRAILSQQLENSKNIQSYAFRRRWINIKFGIDINDFNSNFDRALAGYIYWYRIIELKKPLAWICLERAHDEVPELGRSGTITMRKNPDASQLAEIVNAQKPYLGQIYDLPRGDADALIDQADSFLKSEYNRLRSDLYTVFYARI